MACLFRTLLLISSIYTLRAQKHHENCPRPEEEGEGPVLMDKHNWKHNDLHRIRRDLETMSDKPKELKEEIGGGGGGGGEEGGELERNAKSEPSTKVELKEYAANKSKIKKESQTKRKEELYKKEKNYDARTLASAMNKYYKRLKRTNSTEMEKKMNLKRKQYITEYRRVQELKKLKGEFKPGNSSDKYLARSVFRPFRPNPPRNRVLDRSRSFNYSRYESDYRLFGQSIYRRPFNASRNRDLDRSRGSSLNYSHYESNYRSFRGSRNREFVRSHYRPFNASPNREFPRNYRPFNKSRNDPRYESYRRPFGASPNREFDRSRFPPIIESRFGSYYRPSTSSRKSNVLLNNSGYGTRYRKFEPSNIGNSDGKFNTYRGSEPFRYGTVNGSRYRDFTRSPGGFDRSRGGFDRSRDSRFDRSRDSGFDRSRDSGFDRSRGGFDRSRGGFDRSRGGFDRSRDSGFHRSRDSGFDRSRYYHPRTGSPYDSFPRSPYRGVNISRVGLSDNSTPRDFDWSLLKKYNTSRVAKGHGFIVVNGSRYRDLAEFERLQRIKQLKGEFRPGNVSDQWYRHYSFQYRSDSRNFDRSRSRDPGWTRSRRINGSRTRNYYESWARSGNGTRYIEINGTRYRNIEEFERVQRIKRIKGEFRPGVNEARWSRSRPYFSRPGGRNFSSRIYRRGNLSGDARRPGYRGGTGRPAYGGGGGRPGYGGGGGRPGRGDGRRNFRGGGPKREFRGGAGRVRIGESVEKPDYFRGRGFNEDGYDFRDLAGQKPRYGKRYGRNRYRDWNKNRKPIAITMLAPQEATNFWFRGLESLRLEMKKEEYKNKGLTLSPKELNLTTDPPELTPYEIYRKQNKWQRLADLHSVNLHVHMTPRAVPRVRFNSTGNVKWNSSYRKKGKRKKVKPVTPKVRRSRKNKKKNKKKGKGKGKAKAKAKGKGKGKGDKKVKS